MAKFRDVLRMGVSPELEQIQVGNLVTIKGQDNFLDISQEIRLKLLRDLLNTQRQFIEHHSYTNPADGSVTFAVGANDLALQELHDEILDELAIAFEEGRADEIRAEMEVIRDVLEGIEPETLDRYTKAVEAQKKDKTSLS